MTPCIPSLLYDTLNMNRRIGLPLPVGNASLRTITIVRPPAAGRATAGSQKGS